MISIPTYVSREDVKIALDVAETARSNDRVDRAIESATEDVQQALRRRFSPSLGTRYFNWPSTNYGTSWRLWFNEDELISLTTVDSGGTIIAPQSYFLEPSGQGPPYTYLETNLASQAAFSTGSTHQQAIALTGLWGYRNDEESVGSLAGSLAASAGASVTVTWSTPRVGVGSLLRVDSEYMLVTDKSMVSSGQTLQSPLTAQANSVSVVVSDGTAFGVDQTLLLDSERMRVVDIAGNTLTVKRAYDGSVLAAHTGSTIYALTGITLSRGVQGSTLAAHSASATIYRHLVPPLVRDLALAYAITQLLQEQAGYARVAGTGDNVREVTGRGLGAIERDALRRHGKQQLLRAI